MAMSSVTKMLHHYALKHHVYFVCHLIYILTVHFDTRLDFVLHDTLQCPGDFYVSLYISHDRSQRSTISSSTLTGLTGHTLDTLFQTLLLRTANAANGSELTT
jgi:hypothetical protein